MTTEEQEKRDKIISALEKQATEASIIMAGNRKDAVYDSYVKYCISIGIKPSIRKYWELDRK